MSRAALCTSAQWDAGEGGGGPHPGRGCRRRCRRVGAQEGGAVGGAAVAGGRQSPRAHARAGEGGEERGKMEPWPPPAPRVHATRARGVGGGAVQGVGGHGRTPSPHCPRTGCRGDAASASTRTAQALSESPGRLPNAVRLAHTRTRIPTCCPHHPRARRRRPPT